ncbi:MAG: helix-turn-helix transcriptional regulator [Nocardioides sp.]
MPELSLSEREQKVLRSIIASEPVPGSPIPEQHVLELIAEFIPCDVISAVLMEESGPVALLELPPGSDPREIGGCTLYVGTLHWTEAPLQAAACRALEGVTDGVVVGFRNGPTAIAQLSLDRLKHLFTERDLAKLDLVVPVVQRHLRTRPTPALPAALTVQERRVLNHVATGLSNSEIAECLFIAPSTVRKHLENAYRKLGVTNRLAAVVAVQGVPPAEPDRAERIQRAG